MWRVRRIALAGAILLPALAVVYAVDPSRYALGPPCPYKLLTGWACPGCGLTRCVHAALHGDFARAWQYNPWIFVAMPAALVFATLPRVTGEAKAQRLRTALAWVMLGVTLAFWVWRNTAAYPWLKV